MRKILAMILALMTMLSGIAAFAEAPVVVDVPLEVEFEDAWWHILLMGGDSRDMTKYGRTDTMMILSVNGAQGRAKLTSIMRDTWVSIPGKKNNKINAANYFSGPELAVQTVNENFGTNIQHYVLINMADMAEIVDLFGGVEVEVTASEKKNTNNYIADAETNFYNERLEAYDYTRVSETGFIHLNGVQAMGYCRDRYSDSDFGRVMRGQEVLLSLASKAQAMDLVEVLNAAAKIAGFVSTNLTLDEVATLARIVLSVEPTTVEQYRIPADGDFKSGTFDGTWMIRPDLPAVQADLAAFLAN